MKKTYLFILAIVLLASVAYPAEWITDYKLATRNPENHVYQTTITSTNRTDIDTVYVQLFSGARSNGRITVSVVPDTASGKTTQARTDSLFVIYGAIEPVTESNWTQSPAYKIAVNRDTLMFHPIQTTREPGLDWTVEGWHIVQIGTPTNSLPATDYFAITIMNVTVDTLDILVTVEWVPNQTKEVR